MAARILLPSVIRDRKGHVFRFLSCAIPRSDLPLDYQETESVSCDDDVDDLKSRVFRLRLPKRSVTNVLKKWVNEGNSITASELRNISKELRKSHRYKHALELSEWMLNHEEFQISDADYAMRIDLMTKVFGVDAAERYFEGLPLSAKTGETYSSLLHSYAGAKLVEKAEELYERMKGLDLALGVLPYNEMMTLYVSIGEVEKVFAIVEELKRCKVAPDLFTYNLWISSCAASFNIDCVKRILDEMRCNSSVNEDWARYINLANIYVSTGHLVNPESNSLIKCEKSISHGELITYDLLIILYAGLGNKDKVDQIWKTLRMTKQKLTSRNYTCILSSYLMLGQIKEVGEVIDQWMQSTTLKFDISVCDRLLASLLEVGLKETADTFRKILIQKSCVALDDDSN